jgi:hypothetical protein
VIFQLIIIRLIKYSGQTPTYVFALFCFRKPVLYPTELRGHALIVKDFPLSVNSRTFIPVHSDI